MEDTAFAHDRLQAALPRLQERLKDLQDAEQDARRWIAYRKAEAERDKLAMNSPASTRQSPRSSPILCSASPQTMYRSSASSIAPFHQVPNVCVSRS
jgi:hypothetical protein